MTVGAARRNLLPFYPAKIRGQKKEGCNHGSEVQDRSQQVRQGRASSSEETKGIWQKREFVKRFSLQVD